MHNAHYDAIIIGAGLTGSAAAWALARRGLDVLVLEARSPGHAEGSSHGSSRIFRTTLDSTEFIDLALRAERLWEELGTEGGAPVLRVTGGVDFGSDRDLDGLHARAGSAGITTEFLTPDAARERWPMLSFDTRVLYSPSAGVVDPTRAVRAFLDGAVRRGAELRTKCPVEAISQNSDRATVTTSDGVFHARSVVLAAGPWLPGLYREHVGEGDELDLAVTEQHVYHFAQRDVDAAWPVLVREADEIVFGLPSGSDVAAPAMKIGLHDPGPVHLPGTPHLPLGEAREAALLNFVARFAPGLDPDPVRRDACLYTTTPDDSFVLDSRGRIVVASPCSGQGAKFMPAIGEEIADLATGGTQRVAAYRLAAHHV